MEFFIASIVMIQLMCILAFIRINQRLVKALEGRFPVEEVREEEDEDLFDAMVQEQKAQREREFAERIERIKAELAASQEQATSNNVAQELHPGVKNLPHNTISNDNIPDIEYAD